MAVIQPFRALRPTPAMASRISELPYDVVSSQEARAVAQGNPRSFFRVSRPEIDLPSDTDPFDERVYLKGRENFERLIRQGEMLQDERPCFYLYRQIMGTRRQEGVVALASCQDYENDLIRGHELTRPAKEKDRLRHIEALNAQTGPVFLTYRCTGPLSGALSKMRRPEPACDFTAPDGVRNTAWMISDPGEIARLEEGFRQIAPLYIADGHHRSAAATRVWKKRKGAGQSGGFLAVIFPHDQVRILPYNRLVKDLNGHQVSGFLERLKAAFFVEPTAGPVTPDRRHRIGLYLPNQWFRLDTHPELAAADHPVARLDVALLQRHVLAPILGIHDPRSSSRIEFVGGIRGTAELQARVDSGECACAFSMFPTRVEELMDISDAHELMPPKSTWFEPKLRDGLFCHLL